MVLSESGIGIDQYQVPCIGIGIDQYQVPGIGIDQNQVLGVLNRLSDHSKKKKIKLIKQKSLLKLVLNSLRSLYICKKNIENYRVMQDISIQSVSCLKRFVIFVTFARKYISTENKTRF